MRKTLLYVAILGFIILNTGCSLIAKPKIQDVRARVDNIDLRGIHLVFDVDIYNPYPVAIRTPEFRYGLDIAEEEFIKSRDTTEIDLPALKTGTVTLPAHIEYLTLGRTYRKLSDADQVDYRLHGTVVVKAMQEIFELPVQYSGKFPVFRFPSISMPRVDFSDVSLSGAKVVIKTDISNPNVFRLGLGKLNFDVRVGDVQVGKIRPSLPDGLDAKASSKLSLVGEITASRALMQLIGGKSLGKPSIQCIGSVETPYGMVLLDKK
ncbi:MAG: LEA/WHy family protein [Planctomycetota bacterium]|jgi:LEA14-like dessication related protein